MSGWAGTLVGVLRCYTSTSFNQMIKHDTFMWREGRPQGSPPPPIICSCPYAGGIVISKPGKQPFATVRDPSARFEPADLKRRERCSRRQFRWHGFSEGVH